VQDLLKRRTLADQILVLMSRLQFFLQPFRFCRERLNLLLRFHTIMDIAKNEGREFAPMQLKTGQCRFRRERFAVGTARGEATGNPP
jgi:hypothetical protein